MSAEWYLHKNGNQYGPYTWDQVCGFAREGRLERGDNVWNREMAGWTPAEQVNGLLPTTEEPLSSPRARTDGEDLLGIIPALKKKTGVFTSKTYTLVVTGNRLIFAELTNQMLKDAAAEAAEETKGKGILTRMKETATSQQRVYRRYAAMTPAQILQENPHNFYINNGEVVNIKLKYGHYYDDASAHKDDDVMFIRTTREKMKLFFLHDTTLKDAKKILWRAIGNRVK